MSLFQEFLARFEALEPNDVIGLTELLKLMYQCDELSDSERRELSAYAFERLAEHVSRETRQP